LTFSSGCLICANVNQPCHRLDLIVERSYAKRFVMPTWAAQAG
jgi:hypothetical protein